MYIGYLLLPHHKMFLLPYSFSFFQNDLLRDCHLLLADDGRIKDLLVNQVVARFPALIKSLAFVVKICVLSYEPGYIISIFDFSRLHKLCTLFSLLDNICFEGHIYSSKKLLNDKWNFLSFVIEVWCIFHSIYNFKL